MSKSKVMENPIFSVFLSIFLTDLRRIYNSDYLDPDRSPSSLQKKVMFDIRYYMCRCGGENIKDMTKETFQLHFDTETNISYVKKVMDEISKNHQECDNEIITGFMPQMLTSEGFPHKLCPVRAFENYTTKLHPDSNDLWQKPKKKFPKDIDKPWYDKVKVGHNTHEKFMSTVSEECNLSKRYTNHCLRVTGITNLSRGNFNAKQIISVSGHKSLDSLAIYQRVKNDEKLMMGMCLTYSLLKPEDALLLSKSVEENPEITPKKNIPALPPATTSMPPVPEIQHQPPIPLEDAIVPYQPRPENANFDLMSLIAEVQNEEIPDEDLVLAATQYEESMPNDQQISLPTSTSTKTALMRKSYQPSPFTNCSIGSIGTINIHIHKH